MRRCRTCRLLRGSQRDCHIAVTARIVWEHDGAEDIETTAQAYTRDAVLVQLLDHRLAHTVAVWVAPTDVRRRPLGQG